MKPIHFIYSFLFVAAAAAANSVKPDTLYYISSVVPGRHVTHYQQNYETECPQSVFLTPPSTGTGTPVKFFILGGSDESPSVSIQFVSESWPCDGESMVWRANTQSPHITTDGCIGDFKSKFTMEKQGDDTYIFKFCEIQEMGCMYLGLFNGLHHIGLSPDPIPFKLKAVEAEPEIGIKMFPSH